MPSNFALAGAQPSKPIKFAPIFNARFSSGIWTNRSPLRDATTSREVEDYYGPSNDALIAGQNVEISNKLTLTRRPGCSVFPITQKPLTPTVALNSVDRFYPFRVSSPSTEQITVMIDQANSLNATTTSFQNQTYPIWFKSPGAGQTYMQAVGNTLYFANGVDNKKWLQSLTQWSPNAQWNNGSNPFLSTFIIDPFGNLQQLTGTVIPILQTVVENGYCEVFTGNFSLGGAVAVGDTITFPQGMNASVLDGTTQTIVDIQGSVFVFQINTPDYALISESGFRYATVNPGDGTPISGPSQPAWSVTIPYAGNNFKGGVTVDGFAQWTNRGNPVENWGISMQGSAPTVPVVTGAALGWAASTVFGQGFLIDSNGNLQQAQQNATLPAGQAGTSGANQPKWNTTLGGLTYDGTNTTAITWKLVSSAAWMSWQPNTLYPAGSILVETVSGQAYVYQARQPSAPYLASTLNAYIWAAPHSGAVGQWDGVDAYPTGLPYPTDIGTSLAQAAGLTGFDFSVGSSFAWNVNGPAGNTGATTNPFPGQSENLFIVVEGTLEVPVPGQYTFQVTHGDGFQMGIGGNAVFVSGTAPVDISGSLTAVNGYPVAPAGHNLNVTSNGGNAWVDTYTYDFPTAGTYPIEGNIARWDKANAGLSITCAGNTITQGTTTGGGTSGSTEPVWPVFTTSDAPGYARVTESGGQLEWDCIAFKSDINTWHATTPWMTSGTPNGTIPGITDGNDNLQRPFRPGLSGTSSPSFSTTLDALTDDLANLIWINDGPNPQPPAGNITTSNGGWIYAVSLVNTLDQTVSNASQVSAATGDFTGAQYVFLPPGAGLPPVSQIDPQADYVAIWRSTDGEATPFLIPAGNDLTAPVTIPLWQYLTEGYQDTTLDTGLNNLISAPLLGENTPPPPGAINLEYHLGRLFYSVGNTVYWTSGPDTPVGNGVNGTNPLNYDVQQSSVSRLVRNTAGLVVCTVSDVNMILGNGTASSPIQAAIPLFPGIGLLSYNALATNAGLIGMFSSDSQFLIIDPNNGVSSAGFPLGDQFRQNNGQPGQSWNPANVYVAWHVQGEDQAWYVADGVNGWYRLMTTPAPETGMTWSPFATIVQGCKAVQSIEITPGVHRLLLGPTGKGNVMFRDLTTNQDGGVSYPANAVIGSIVLVRPGQVAVVSFITVESVGVGTPIVLGVLVDEALPYYQGSFDVLKHWVNDPPNLKPSKSLPAQRFYLSELEDDAMECRHLQIQVNWAAENAPNELLTMAIFGGFSS